MVLDLPPGVRQRELKRREEQIASGQRIARGTIEGTGRKVGGRQVGVTPTKPVPKEPPKIPVKPKLSPGAKVLLARQGAENLKQSFARGEITKTQVFDSIRQLRRESGLRFPATEIQDILGAKRGVKAVRRAAREAEKQRKITEARVPEVPVPEPRIIPIIPIIPPRDTDRVTTRKILSVEPAPEIGLPGVLGRVERALPTAETIIGEPRSPFGTLIEQTTRETALGQGTSIVQETVRTPTFEEQLEGISKKDIDDLKRKVEVIQFNLASGKINETQANVQFQERIDKFESNQIKKGLLGNFAIGAALTLLSATVPLLGPAITGVIATDLFLKRRGIVKQFRKFPIESSLQTGAFIAGGLVGSRVGAKFRGTPPKINAETLESSTFIKGAEKQRFVKQMELSDPNFLRLKSTGKITDTIVYDVVLNDGRTFRILEFGKTQADPFSGKTTLVTDRGFTGAEITKIAGEKIVGGAVGRLERQTGEGKVFTQVVRFTPKRGAFTGKDVGFERGKTIESATKLQIFDLGGGKSGVISNSVILKIKNTNPALIRRILSIERKVAKGQKITIKEIQNMINLQRSTRGQLPFTEAEFKAGQFPTITGQVVTRLLTDAKLVAELNTKIARGSLTLKAKLKGEALTIPVTPKPELGRVPKKTPFEVTFADTKAKTTFNQDLIKLSKKFRELKNRFRKQTVEGATTQSKQQTQQQMKRVNTQVKQLENQFTQTTGTSIGPLSQALSLNIKNDPIVKLKSPTILFIQGLSPALRNLVANETSLNNRLIQTNKTLQVLQSRQKLKLSLSTKTQNLTAQTSIQQLNQQIKQMQSMAQKLVLIQKLNLQLRTQNVSRQDVNIANIPVRLKKIIPGVPSVGEARRGKPFVRPDKKNQGFHAWSRQGGIRKRINKVPLEKKQARDLSSWVGDNSTSANFGITKAINKKAQKPLIRIPTGYFKKTQKKYRPFRIVGGKQVPLLDEFIERKRFRLDTRNEVKQINVARATAQRRKKIVKKTTKSNLQFKKKPFSVPKSNLKTTKLIKRRKKK